ncbi:uncharacterized protein LOC108090208 [Drosophila ficusphila]|uniref:uncharacterized protein LOC108090208 n=1 Tax=Drosophila ficusphila TaxID=30025 RepID=UPI0007E7CF24|nr:uncharacterized protein LOC108090208 [Drosophila ficusphila]
MRYYFIVTIALMSYSFGAPMDPVNSTSKDAPTATLTSADNNKNVTEGTAIDGNNEFWILATPPPSITKLPESDKKVLCDFLDSFSMTRMILFAIILGANVEFTTNASKYFPNEFEMHMNNLHATKDENYFGIDEAQVMLALQNQTVMEEYSRMDVVKGNTLKMLNKIYQGFKAVNKQLLDDFQKMKSSLSKETVDSEQEFLLPFENIKEPTMKYDSEIADLLNKLEIRFKYKYQCIPTK